jgi:hypothetical protein
MLCDQLRIADPQAVGRLLGGEALRGIEAVGGVYALKLHQARRRWALAARVGRRVASSR